VEFNEVLPFLQENRLAVVTTVSAKGRAQSTVVGAGPYDGQMAFVSRARTTKVKNVRRTGRCTVTVIKTDTRRYITVEGPAKAYGWDDTDADTLLALLRSAYAASGRPPETWDDFDSTMREEQRNVVLITPERVYGSI
jgi:PPOX class probable F420-dependent enzyme